MERLLVRIPPTAKLKLSVVRSLPGLTQPIRWNDYRLSVAGVLHIEFGLKIRIYVLRWLAMVSDCIGARVKNDTRPARHKQYTHGHRVEHAASSKNPPVNTWAKIGTSHSTNSGRIAHILIGLSSPNGLNTIDRRRIHPRAWPSYFTGGI